MSTSELVSILFTTVRDYGNEYMTKENKNFAPKVNLNHYMHTLQCTFIISNIIHCID